MTLQRRIFARMYRRAQAPEALPWHRDEPPELLRAAAERGGAGRTLDLGCGSGVNAVYLARHGYSVVGVDFVPTALELARTRAATAGVTLELRECDVLDFQAPAPFDLVVDSGCLHHIPSAKLGAYRARLDEWLRPGGHFVLVHFARRDVLDWIPGGPRRAGREAITRLFAPLRLEAYDETVFRLSFPMGPMRAGIYWFRREDDPARFSRSPERS